ncbi:hypothetical protein HPB49_010954 [Dermacentor silvarum]|uniref:Uncharacterized protein n=1 Tax=Dermacentor silvarum TaxID=543639 RepID=A0ACB8DZ15_DERSI|nr:hypothetical protein HPB49_010954 [Dermacentor silvarum]
MASHLLWKRRIDYGGSRREVSHPNSEEVAEDCKQQLSNDIKLRRGQENPLLRQSKPSGQGHRRYLVAYTSSEVPGRHRNFGATDGGDCATGKAWQQRPAVTSGISASVEDHSAGAVASEGQRETDLRSLADQCRVLELEVELARLRQNGSGSSRESGHAFSVQNRCGELRRYSKCLAGVLPKFPSEAEAPVWFESVESALKAYEVPGGFWGQIVFPLVAEKVPFLSTRLSPAEHKEYLKIKETVLDELKLSAGEYLKRFLGSGRRANEGWRPYATRLQSYLHFYLDSRGVSTFEELVKLLVADQLKKNLSDDALRYVTLQEGKAWLKAPDLAALLRTLEEAQGKNSAGKQVKQKPAESQSASNA